MHNLMFILSVEWFERKYKHIKLQGLSEIAYNKPIIRPKIVFTLLTNLTLVVSITLAANTNYL